MRPSTYRTTSLSRSVGFGPKVEIVLDGPVLGNSVAVCGSDRDGGFGLGLDFRQPVLERRDVWAVFVDRPLAIMVQKVESRAPGDSLNVA
jgi:hypothetical protein